ncbi:unnamed protein product [Dimorphilus gyrociliatus]|uniref:Uncharacterized protein n=1 Tax=Dimorphilus gyrociliatus TaxID=2664684 RepID=A0A7I8VXV3_9ANNE|nr:unnamed protein product [Dimorphilus gyrociliatus]
MANSHRIDAFLMAEIYLSVWPPTCVQIDKLRAFGQLQNGRKSTITLLEDGNIKTRTVLGTNYYRSCDVECLDSDDGLSNLLLIAVRLTNAKYELTIFKCQSATDCRMFVNMFRESIRRPMSNWSFYPKEDEVTRGINDAVDNVFGKDVKIHEPKRPINSVRRHLVDLSREVERLRNVVKRKPSYKMPSAEDVNQGRLDVIDPEFSGIISANKQEIEVIKGRRNTITFIRSSRPTPVRKRFPQRGYRR